MILANVHGCAVLKNNDKNVYIKHVWIKIQEILWSPSFKIRNECH
jgi:hypothetical protein